MAEAFRIPQRALDELEDDARRHNRTLDEHLAVVRGPVSARSDLDRAHSRRVIDVFNVLIAAWPDGLTDEQIAEVLGVNPLTARLCRQELSREGLVRDSGGRVKRPWGLACVWELTRTGEDARDSFVLPGRADKGLTSHDGSAA